MAVTPSTMRELGTRMPTFSLPDVVSGEQVSSAALIGQVSVVAFICNHCPFVIHLKPQLVQFGKYCAKTGVKLVAISSNDVTTHPADSPENMAKDAQQLGYPFPYLFDESQDTARAFDAACTPDFFAFDATGALAYRGQFDSSRPSKSLPVTGEDLKAAVDALLAGRAPSAVQQPSIGCNIKWKR
jgi:peroxiredoxin